MVLCELVMPQLDGLMLIRAGLKIDPHLIQATARLRLPCFSYSVGSCGFPMGSTAADTRWTESPGEAAMGSFSGGKRRKSS